MAGGAAALLAGAAVFATNQPSVEMASTDYSVPQQPAQAPMPSATPISPADLVQQPVVSTPGLASPAAVPAAGAAGVARAEPVIAYGGAERLASLDALRADIEEAKLRADLAKFKAQERDAGTAGAMSSPIAGTSSMPATGASLPPLPIFPAAGVPMPASLDMPPLPPSRGGSGMTRSVPSAPASSSGGVEFLEAWGAGRDVQARIMTPGGDRIVRVGDAVPGGRVESITGTALTIRGANGKSRTFN